MKITYELDLDKFEAWSGGEDTVSRIQDEGKEEEFYALLETVYPDGIDETKLNDLLRFEGDWIYRSLGMNTDDELEDEDAEAREAAFEVIEEGESYYDLCARCESCNECPLGRWSDNCHDVFDELVYVN